jgi:3-hydroxybutyryl-CoA dehydrogenase
MSATELPSLSLSLSLSFLQPVPVMKLVEVISGLQTSPETLQTTLALAEAMGKTCSSSKDVPGFIANRLLMPYLNEGQSGGRETGACERVRAIDFSHSLFSCLPPPPAIFALQDGISSREDIDTCMKLGCNMPMGPLTLADFIGLDTCLAIMNVLHEGLGDSKYRPAPLLQSYVDAGWLGKKTGRGFFEYAKK